MLVYFCCLDLQLLGETVREIVDFCTVIEEDFARMRVNESFGHKEPKMGGLKCGRERGVEEMGGYYSVWG
jgi:hypothetical protein